MNDPLPVNQFCQSVIIIKGLQAFFASFLVRLNLLENLLDVWIRGEFILSGSAVYPVKNQDDLNLLAEHPRPWDPYPVF